MVPPPVKPHMAWLLAVFIMPLIFLWSLKWLLVTPLRTLFESLIMRVMHDQIALAALVIGLMVVSGGGTSILVGLCLRRWRQRDRRFDRWRRQRCTECDYDLRAHPGGGNCPECAAPVPEKFVPPNPVPAPGRPRPLWLMIPLLVVPALVIIWLMPLLEAWSADDLAGVMATFGYCVAAGYLITPYVIHHRWKNGRCTRCRCDLRGYLGTAGEGAAICPECGTPIPEMKRG